MRQVLLGRAAAALLLQAAYICQWLAAITGTSSSDAGAQWQHDHHRHLPLAPAAALPHRHHELILLGSATLTLSSNLVLLINGLLAAASAFSNSRAAGQPWLRRKLELQPQGARRSVYEEHATAMNLLTTGMHTCAQLVACAADAAVRGVPPPASRLAAITAAAGLNLAVNGDSWGVFLPQLGVVLVAAAALAAADGGTGQRLRQVWYLAGAARQLAAAAAAAVALQWWLRRRWLLAVNAGSAATAASASPGGLVAGEASELAPQSKYFATYRLYRVWPLPAGYCLNGTTSLLLPVSEGDDQPSQDAAVTSYCRQQRTAPPPVRMSTGSRYSQGWRSPQLQQEEEGGASGSSRNSSNSGSSASTFCSRRATGLFFHRRRTEAAAAAAGQAVPMQPPAAPSQLDVAWDLSQASASAFRMTQRNDEAGQPLAEAKAGAEGSRTGAAPVAACSTAAGDGHAICGGGGDAADESSTDATGHVEAVRQLRAACATVPSQLPSAAAAAAGRPLAAAAADGVLRTSDELMWQALSTGACVGASLSTFVRSVWLQNRAPLCSLSLASAHVLNMTSTVAELEPLNCFTIQTVHFTNPHLPTAPLRRPQEVSATRAAHHSTSSRQARGSATRSSPQATPSPPTTTFGRSCSSRRRCCNSNSNSSRGNSNSRLSWHPSWSSSTQCCKGPLLSSGHPRPRRRPTAIQLPLQYSLLRMQNHVRVARRMSCRRIGFRCPAGTLLMPTARRGSCGMHCPRFRCWLHRALPCRRPSPQDARCGTGQQASAALSVLAAAERS